MKKKKLLIPVIIVASLLICAIVIVAHATITNEQALVIMDSVINDSDYSADMDLNGDGRVDVLDVILSVKQGVITGPKLETLTLDDGTELNFAPGKLYYSVNLSAGRPRIPVVSATAGDGVEIEVVQASIADGAENGVAKVYATDSAGTTSYTINFKRADASTATALTLQYDDRYQFPKSVEGTATYTSSNPDVVSVNSTTGVMTAKAVSSSPVTITATGDTTATVSVDVIKAQINLFFVTGQSNAQGHYDYDTSTQEGKASHLAQLDLVEQPTQEGQVYCYDVHPIAYNATVENITANTPYDMAVKKRQGFMSALGKTWYEETGEKVFLISSAWSGAPIEAWLDPDRHPDDAGTYGGNNRHNFYDNTQAAYTDVITNILTSDKYEVNHRYNFWLQGETCMGSIYNRQHHIITSGAHTGEWVGDWGAGDNPDYIANKGLMTDEEYYNYFIWMHNDMKEDFGIEYNGILLVRATASVSHSEDKELQLLTSINNIRAAQYALANENADIGLVSRVCDITRMESWTDTTVEGWGYMGPKNLHYNQTGHNANGQTAGQTMFGYLQNTKATEVEIIATNGRDRLEEGVTITLEEGKSYRAAALALPMSSQEDLTWSSSDSAIASVNKFGLITAVSDGIVTVTAASESGLKRSINVVVLDVKVESVKYRWDFADTDTALNSTAGNGYNQNNLTNFNGKTYTVTDGIINAVNTPVLAMEKDVVLDSSYDWSIRYRMAVERRGILLGQTSGYTDYLYIAHAINFGNDLYPLAFTINGLQHKINYNQSTDYRTPNTTMNTWELSYDADTKVMTLYYYGDDTNTSPETVGSISAMGDYSVTYNALFGMLNTSNGSAFNGTVDYIEIKTTDIEISYPTEKVSYEWNFNNADNPLAEKNGLNNLTLSEKSAGYGAADNYSIADGIYKSTGITQQNRPDFTMEKPITLSNGYSFSIEWKAKFASGSIILGGVANSKNNIYAAYGTSAFGYPIRFTESSKNIDIPYGDYSAKNTAWGVWRLEYNANTNYMSFYYSADGTSWEVVGCIKAGTFETTFTNVFGRFHENGISNFQGEVDYLKVDFEQLATGHTAAKQAVGYEWNFDDAENPLNEKNGLNNLTLSETAAANNAAGNYSVTDGIYKSTGIAQLNRPDFTMDKAFTLNSDNDFAIQWRTKLASASMLFGKAANNNNYLYAAYSTAPFGNPIRFADTSRTIDITYGDYQPSKATSWGTWRLEYSAASNYMSFYYSADDGVTWETVGTTKAGTFSATYTNVFGRFNANGVANFQGEIDYLKVDFYE